MTLFYLTVKGKTAHVVNPESTRLTYCGRRMTPHGTKLEVRPPGRRPCQACHVGAMRRLSFPFEGEYQVNEAAVRRSFTLDARTIVELEHARVFTLEGASGGLYQVVIAPGLNPTCTCLAGKTKPLELCKHVAKVLAVTAGLVKVSRRRVA